MTYVMLSPIVGALRAVAGGYCEPLAAAVAVAVAARLCCYPY